MRMLLTVNGKATGVWQGGIGAMIGALLPRDTPRLSLSSSEYEYEPLDELIATALFTRCSCYYRRADTRLILIFF